MANDCTHSGNNKNTCCSCPSWSIKVTTNNNEKLFKGGIILLPDFEVQRTTCSLVEPNVHFLLIFLGNHTQKSVPF